MAWSRQQNPTGISNPAVRPILADPVDNEPAKQDERKRQRALAARTIPARPSDLPIAANARKADAFAPQATSAGQ
jgi:hypothetical protein